MAETKACSLTETEIKAVIASHMIITVQTQNISNEQIDEALDRLNYLNKRLKAFAEAPESQLKAAMTESQAAAATNAPVKEGW